MRKLRVMVFDDEEPILTLFREFFSGKDCEVLTYPAPVVCPIYDHRSHSCPALSPCADVVITDYKMPGMNGLQLLREQVRMGCALPLKNKALISGHCDEAVQAEIEAMGYVFSRSRSRSRRCGSGFVNAGNGPTFRFRCPPFARSGAVPSPASGHAWSVTMKNSWRGSRSI